MSESNDLPSKSPYELLAGLGIDPQSTHIEVLDAMLAGQEQGIFSARLRVAWDLIGTPEQRLATDFFLVEPGAARPLEMLRAALSARSKS